MNVEAITRKEMSPQRLEVLVAMNPELPDLFSCKRASFHGDRALGKEIHVSVTSWRTSLKVAAGATETCSKGELSFPMFLFKRNMDKGRRYVHPLTVDTFPL